MKKQFRGIAAAGMAVALVGALGLFGCAGNSQQKQDAPKADAVTLQIFAANSLQKALPEVQALYTQETGVQFADTQFEASGTLVEKLASGGTADVLITASAGSMDTAVENKSIAENTRADMFTNDLVVCAKTDSDIEVKDVKDLATNDKVESIAIGEPNAVPAGKYALQTLESAGLAKYTTNDDKTISDIKWDKSIEKKMNAGADKVGTVASYVADGTCTVGMVYTSDIYRYDGIEAIYTTPADSHKAIVYPGAVCSSAAQADAAADFLKFCMENADAQKIFAQYGFELA